MSTAGKPGDFLVVVAVGESVRAVIEQTAEEFERTGDWATLDTLAYKAAELGVPTDLNDAFKLPGVIGGVWDGEKVNLTALGLVLAGTAPETTKLMLQLVEIAADRKLRLRGEAKIGQEVLVSEYGLSPTDAMRAQALVQLIPGLSGGGLLGADWSLDVHRGALNYREVHNIDSFREVLKAQAFERLSQKPSKPVPTYDPWIEGSYLEKARSLVTLLDEMKERRVYTDREPLDRMERLNAELRPAWLHFFGQIPVTSAVTYPANVWFPRYWEKARALLAHLEAEPDWTAPGPESLLRVDEGAWVPARLWAYIENSVTRARVTQDPTDWSKVTAEAVRFLEHELRVRTGKNPKSRSTSEPLLSRAMEGSFK